MRELLYWLALASRAARQPLYLAGETGVGKSALARAMHAALAPSHGFVEVSLPTLGDSIAFADLFGTERGAFTGAIRRRGRVCGAADGTFFVDEVAKAPLRVQATLLQFIDTGTFTPTGGERAYALATRVIAACSGDPDQQRKSGDLLDDLVARFTGFIFHVPPLRERREDLPALVDAALEAASQEVGIATPRLPARVRDAFVNAPWPTNFRGLRAACMRVALCHSDGHAIDESILTAPGMECMGMPPKVAEPVGQAELLETLRRNGGNRSQTARELGVDRTTIVRRLRLLDEEQRKQSLG